MAIWNNDKKTEKKNSKQSSVDLSDVIKGMQKAVNEAQKMLETHNLRSLRSFFYEDGDPKTLELHLSDKNYLEIPILALANHNSLVIDKLSMEFEAKIEQVGIRSAEDLLEAVTKNNKSSGTAPEVSVTEDTAVFGIGFAGEPNSNMLKVKLEFTAAPRPEGLSRILDEYNKLVVPFTAAEGVDNSPWKDHDDGEHSQYEI